MALPAGFTIIEDDAPAGLPAGFSLMDEEKKKKEYSFTDWFNNPFSGEAEGEFQMPTMDETAAGMTNPAGVGPFQGGGEAALAGFTEASARPLYGALDMLEEEGFLNTLPLELTEGTVLNKTRRKEALEFAQGLQEQSPVGSTIGGTIGEVAKYALPGTIAKMAGGALPVIAGAEIFGSGLLKGVETPEEGGDSRLKAGLKEMAWTAGGLGAGKVLEKALRGADKVKGAQEYIDQGGSLTPGQAAESTAIRGLENVAEVTPFLAKGTKEFRKIAEEGVSESMINRVAKNIDSTADEIPLGHEGMKKLGVIVEDGYDEAWDAIDSTLWNDPQSRKHFFTDMLKDTKKMWGDSEGATIGRIIKLAEKKGVGLKQMDRKIRSMMNNAKGDFLDELGEIRQELRTFAGDDGLKKLDNMDRNYGDFLVVQDAASKTGRGTFSADRLAKSSRSVGGTSRAAKGEAPLQEIAEDLAESMSKTGGQPLEWLRRVAGSIPTPVPRTVMKKLGDMVIGETDSQRAIQKLMQDEDFRQLIVRSGMWTGATIGGDEDGER